MTKTQINEAALKPCPCCGSARIISVSLLDNGYRIACSRCPIYCKERTKTLCRKAWNTRAALPSNEVTDHLVKDTEMVAGASVNTSKQAISKDVNDKDVVEMKETGWLQKHFDSANADIAAQPKCYCDNKESTPDPLNDAALIEIIAASIWDDRHSTKWYEIIDVYGDGARIRKSKYLKIAKTAVETIRQHTLTSGAGNGWRPLSEAPEGYDGKKFNHILFRGFSKAR